MTVVNTLNTDQILRTLDRIFAAELHDVAAIADIGTRLPGADGQGHLNALHSLPPEKLAEALSDVVIPVSRETGELLYVLARNRGARRIVEYGTSHGASAIYLAAAVRDNGGGQVIGTELQPNKVRSARANLAAAGLADLVEVREGDARETLRSLPGPVDMVLIDGFASLYRDVLRVIEPQLAPGALVVADGMPPGPEAIAEYLDYVRDPANGYTSVALPLGDGGVELSLRCRVN
ncbi:class I SAM-dependent methyltransferase [Streptomyces sp. NPDC048442]|uniref:O-methyltransferase n=1 Tax=Streptomyces sp. NPDC048442 TaxID=3154823 RepID=UPI0034269FE1